MAFMSHRHCERSEAIQTPVQVDCFVAALLAMTKNEISGI